MHEEMAKEVRTWQNRWEQGVRTGESMMPAHMGHKSSGAMLSSSMMISMSKPIVDAHSPFLPPLSSGDWQKRILWFVCNLCMARSAWDATHGTQRMARNAWHAVPRGLITKPHLLPSVHSSIPHITTTTLHQLLCNPCLTQTLVLCCIIEVLWFYKVCLLLSSHLSPLTSHLYLTSPLIFLLPLLFSLSPSKSSLGGALSLQVGIHILRHIFSYIHPAEQSFLMLTCSSWNNTIRYTTPPSYTSSHPLSRLLYSYLFSHLPLSYLVHSCRQLRDFTLASIEKQVHFAARCGHIGLRREKGE